MKLFDYLKLLKKEDFTFTKETLNLDELRPPLELYSAYLSYLEKNLISFLTSLSEDECLVFYTALQNDGFELEILEEKENKELKEALNSLKSKLLLRSLVSVKRLTPANKVFVFPEIQDLIGKRFRFYDRESLLKKINRTPSFSIFQSYPEMPFDFFFFLCSYGFVCRQDFAIQQFGEAACQYFLDEKALSEVILYNEKQFYPCYELNSEKIENKDFTVIRSISYQTRIFNDIIRLIYFITRDDILITKKGEVNKKHYDKLARELKAEKTLWFLIRFLTKYGFIENDFKKGYMYLSQKGYAFFQQEIEEVYDKILNSDLMLKEIFDTVSQMHHKEFGIADVVLTYLKKQLKESFDAFLYRETRRKVIQYIEILTYMGVLIQKFTAEGFTLYELNSHYKNIVNEKNWEKKPLMISPSMEVQAYPHELDLQTGYLLNVFLELENFSDLLHYRITPIALRRALYFGFNEQMLIKLLKEKSRNPLSSNIESNIKRWAEQYQSGSVKQAVLLKAEAHVLDQLEHQPDFSHLIIERLNQETAVVDSAIYHNRILEDAGIFLYLEDFS